MSGALVARMDSLGDVLLAGPLVRAVAAATGPVTFLCSPTGEAAAALLPGVGRVVVGRAPWIEADPAPVSAHDTRALVEAVRSASVGTAVISTSFHQSPLPLALLLRLAGVATIGAISVDYPGALLDVRHRVGDDIHEVERSLSLGAAMGFRLPPGDDGGLRVHRPAAAAAVLPPSIAAGGYVVVHPGASVPARAWHAEGHRALVSALAAEGRPVVVTGSRDEAQLTAEVAGNEAVDLGGRLDVGRLAAVLAGASAVVVGNTGPAHLAAAVGTPVVSLYAPTVPATRWRPWMVDHELLGEQAIGCAGCRARTCPVPGHPCLDRLDVAAVVAAVGRLAGRGRPLVQAGAES